MPPLPIDAVLPELLAALRDRPSVVLRAATGAGKTTRVPPAMLDAGLANGKRLVVLEPRRLAARAAARRMASERGGRVGDEIGYHVRFDRCSGPRTRLLVVTPGILLRMLHDEPYLDSLGLIVFDEFHERSLEADLALGMTRLAQTTVRDDLRLVVMSATLSTERVAAYLGGAPVIASEGRLHPVELIHEPRPDDRHRPAAVARAVERLLDRTHGDVLVFLPGMQEIRRTARLLEPLARARGLSVLPLHGDLPAEQQDTALQRLDRRKVVLATNVAETSVTVDGVTSVVDAGLARQLGFDIATGLDRLTLVPISRASAEQRAGRAGRTEPGTCIRLWPLEEHRLRDEQTAPEIQRIDLAGSVLQLLSWGEREVAKFPWLESPRAASLDLALALLRRLGATSDDGVTALGRTMARLPVHPRLARMLIEGQQLGQPSRVALAAALLAERDPFTPTGATAGMAARPTSTSTQSDLLDRVRALEEFESHGHRNSSLGTLDRTAASFVLRARDQLARMVKDHQPNHPAPNPARPIRRESGRGKRKGEAPAEPRELSSDVAVLRALVPAFSDRLARRRERASDRAVLVGGRGVRLGTSSGVHEAELFLCLELDAGQSEAVVHLASAVERAWLPVELAQSAVEVSFDEANEQVVAKRIVRFEDLVLEEGAAQLPRGEAVAAALAQAASLRLDHVLPPTDSRAAQFLTRVRWLRGVMPELNLPAFDDLELRALLPAVCHGCRSFAQVRERWSDALAGALTHAQCQAVAREAPERLVIPSGSRVALQYEVGRPPVLAVRLQELFGLGATPRVAGGRVPVLLHLLAPNLRPQQVTDDLASFWANVYPQVRSERRRRYPKHAWPEDPLSATPQRGTKRNRDTA